MKAHSRPSRRRFLKVAAGGLGLSAIPSCVTDWLWKGPPFFKTRGIVLLPDDLTLSDWPDRAKDAGLTTIALHDGQSPSVVARFIKSERGHAFLAACRSLELDVEYELHAMAELLPRDMFEKDPSLFRMSKEGERTSDANLCVNSEGTLEIVANHAQALARQLRPTTHRYFLWGDDAKAWCRCRRCAALSDSDQSLLLTNALVKALRKDDEKAQIAHLAYVNTLQPPMQVKPAPGVFLEFAPSRRSYDAPLDKREDEIQRRHLEALDANLAVFGSGGAQVLEYWLDCSKISEYKKPARQVTLQQRLFASDLTTYGSRGIRNITTFGCYLDAAYTAKWGSPPVDAYGTQLLNWRPS